MPPLDESIAIIFLPGIVNPDHIVRGEKLMLVLASRSRITGSSHLP
jgi:hypothetical protein